VPKQIENTSAAQPLNKARWMQTLDELEREYLAFQCQQRAAQRLRFKRRSIKTIQNGVR
jgi:hypothetical protein